MSDDIFDPSAWSAIEIGLPVDEMGPMKEFYCKGLALKSAGYVDLPGVHIEAFRFGDCLLKLTLFDDIARWPKPRRPEPSDFYLTLRVTAVDEAVARCLALGANVSVPVTSFQTKDLKVGRFAIVSDPMGNRIELVEGNAWSEIASD
jgi:predicted enzyme related to lactoylglutathione lyase